MADAAAGLVALLACLTAVAEMPALCKVRKHSAATQATLCDPG